MHKVFVLFALVLLSGCGAADRYLASLTGDASKTCVDGVVYLQFTSGATLHVNPDGSPVTCQ